MTKTEQVTCPACKGKERRCVLCGGKGKVSKGLAEIYLATKEGSK